MTAIKTKIDSILKERNVSYYQLSKLIDFDESALNKMLKGKISLSPNLLEKVAPILGVSKNEILAWALASKYSQETLKRALELQKEHARSGQKVAVIKLRELMEERNLKICAFAGALGYNQGRLSQVRLGNVPISEKLVPKLVAFSGLSEDEINSWLVADKYPAKILRLAVEL